MWEAYDAARSPGDPLGVMGSFKHSIEYYSAGSYVDIESGRELSAFLDGPGTKFLILPRRDLARVERSGLAGAGRWERVHDSHPTHVLVRLVNSPS
jgi:hypothetical protein